jgi:hypothetical protein
MMNFERASSIGSSVRMGRWAMSTCAFLPVATAICRHDSAVRSFDRPKAVSGAVGGNGPDRVRYFE